MVKWFSPNPSLKKQIYVFVLIYAISRTFILFLPGAILDLIVMKDFKLFVTPFSDVPNFPPFLVFQTSIFLMIFGVNLLAYRFAMIFYEIGTIIILYKFVQQFQMREFNRTPSEVSSNAIWACYLYSFFSLTLFSYLIFLEFIANFYMLLGLYAYYKNKVALGAFFLCLGTITEFYPVFCLIPIVINLLIKKQFKNLVKIISSFMMTFVVVNGLLFFTSPTNFFISYFTQISHIQSLSLWDILQKALPVWNLFTIFNLIQINPFGLTFIIFLVGYIILVTRYFYKHKNTSHRQEFTFYLILTLLLPGVFLSLLPRFLFFGLPVLCLFIETKTTFQKHVQFFIGLTIVLAFFSFISLILWSDLTFITPTEELRNLINPLELGLPLFPIIIGLNATIALFWMRWSKQWRYSYIVREKPTNLEYLNREFVLFIVQITLRTLIPTEFTLPILLMIFITMFIGTYYSLRIAIRIYSDRLM